MTVAAASVHIEVWTIGHSTRSIDGFLSLLRGHDIHGIVDVRRYPASRRHPHFSRALLETALKAAGIEYAWLEGLGGRRQRRKDSPHTSWRVAAFAAYADHMETDEFLTAAGELIGRARRIKTAIMCAEALPHRCHRRLISDWLHVRGVTVRHILTSTRVEVHQLTDFARIEDERLLYNAGQADLFGS